MRRTVALVASAAIMSGIALTGCAGSTPNGPDSQGTQGDAQTDQEGGGDEAGTSGASGPFTIGVRKGDNNVAPVLVDAWNAANPDAPATLELLDGNADQQRQQFSLELSAGSSEFDVIGLDVTWTGEFAKNGWIAPLTSLGSQAEESLFPGPLASGHYDGELYAAPLLVGVGLLYYRTDLVDKPADTWQELSEQGRAVAAEQGIDAFVAQGASYEGMVVNYLEYLWGAGGDLFNEDFTEATLTEGTAGLEALEFMRESQENGFYAPGYTTMTEAEARPAFEDGDAVFMRHWIAPYIPMSTSSESAVAGKFAIQPLPTFDGVASVSALGGLNLAVNEFSENKSAAEAFIAWATMSPEAAEILVEAGIAPAAQAPYEGDLTDNAYMSTLAEILPNAKARPPLPEWGEISSVMSRELFASYTGQTEPQAALDTIQETLEKVAEANASK